MADQTASAQAQTQTQTSIENCHNTTTTTNPTVPTAAAAIDTTIAPPLNPSPPSKLPFRPRKIRKLSPTTTTTSPFTPQSSSLIPRITTRPLSYPGELEAALRHLKSADPLISPLIDHYPPPTFQNFQPPPFLALAKSILHQQLAFKAGTSIYNRFISLCGGELNVLPDVVLALTPQQLRQIGISARKASYLHDLSRKFENGILSDKSIVEMDDKSLFTMLTMVNGIGSWSVHMFMIFSLHRPNVLPIHDLGIRKGLQMLLGLEELPKPSRMDHLCEKWRPYRSVAAWYLWRLVEANGVNMNGGGGGNVIDTVRLPEQPQFLDPIYGTLDMRACTWGQ